MLRLLLDHHADANALHPQTSRPPLVAAEDPEVLDILVRHGANLNWVRSTASPLIHSILTSHWDNAVYLIGPGADLSVQPADGTTVESALERVRNADGTLSAGAQRVKDAIAAAR